MLNCGLLSKLFQTLPRLQRTSIAGAAVKWTFRVTVLCGRPCTLRHFLNAYSSALQQGRYTWRHNSVLTIIQKHLIVFLDGRCHAKKGPYSNYRAKIHHVCSSWALWCACLVLVFSPPSHEPEHLVAGIGQDFRFDLGSEPLQFLRGHLKSSHIADKRKNFHMALYPLPPSSSESVIDNGRNV